MHLLAKEDLAAALVLEDGTHYVGRLFGALSEAEGEVVFNTSMAGYLEVCSDPSYRGQMVVMTHPQIGNYGVSAKHAESTRPWVSALIVRELAKSYHHWEAVESLSQQLERYGVPGLEGVDTRAITRRLKSKGTMRAVIRRGAARDLGHEMLERWAQEAREVTPLSQKPLVQEVSGAARGGLAMEGDGPDRLRKIVVVDLGAKHGILRSLAALGVQIETVPWDASLDQILAQKPDGVVLSNGPGDPASLPGAVKLARGLLARQVPLMGVCLGHQVIGLALGATTSRLKFGHHGGNHPVKDLLTGRVYITTQNHEFQVEADSLPQDSGFRVSMVSLNDGSVEGIAHPQRPVLSVQFHPEGRPGPQDNTGLFRDFLAIAQERRGGR